MLKVILERIDSLHLARLWTFYRNYFSSDDECLRFIYDAIYREPPSAIRTFFPTDKAGMYKATDGTEYHDSIFFPRRMLNAVERLVSAARDMEQIKKGQDVFKVVFLITCVETLQGLANSDASKKQAKPQLFSFLKKTPWPQIRHLFQSIFAMMTRTVQEMGQKTLSSNLSPY